MAEKRKVANLMALAVLATVVQRPGTATRWRR
jgi:hypothetical protein